MHAGWDVIQNLTFGARFAGHQVPGVLDMHLLGSPLLTGGSLGLEASIVALVAALALSFYLLVGAVRHGLIAQPFWRCMRQAVPAIASPAGRENFPAQTGNRPMTREAAPVTLDGITGRNVARGA